MEECVNKIGYTELYEFANSSQNEPGKFIGFDKNNPDKVCLYNGEVDVVIGVTSLSFAHISDKYDEWPKKYITNKVGDIGFRKVNYLYGKKEYDTVNERCYMSSKIAQRYEPAISSEYDEEQTYISRLSREEWAIVTLLGKAIVIDNGKCKPGDFCTPYKGNDESLLGTAVKATKKDKHRYYVISRYSDSTILVLIK